MAKIRFKNKLIDPDTVWADWFSTSAFSVDKRLRRVFHMLPHDPRCVFCNSPFEGIGGVVVRRLFGKERSMLNPRYCNMCEEAARRFPGGAEVDMAMLFADIRGSTGLSQQMGVREFSNLISRFFTQATKVISDADGLVEKLAGDAIAAFWGAGFAGPNYVQRTLNVAQTLAAVMERQQIPVGIGVHTGVAYFGTVGAVDGLVNISAIGEEVNLAARLASKAAAGEIIVSERALSAAGIEASHLAARDLDLKGISGPVHARVMHAN